MLTQNNACMLVLIFFFSSRRRHTRFKCDWSSDVCSSDLVNRPSMKLFFPEMVRSIDINAEAKRLQTIKFAPASAAAKPDETGSESLARRRKLPPSTIPNAPEASAALTEGERRIADKNLRAAGQYIPKQLAQ